MQLLHLGGPSCFRNLFMETGLFQAFHCPAICKRRYHHESKRVLDEGFAQVSDTQFHLTTSHHKVGSPSLRGNKNMLLSPSRGTPHLGSE